LHLGRTRSSARPDSTRATIDHTCGEAPLGVRLPNVASVWPQEMDHEAQALVDRLHQAHLACDDGWNTLYARVLAA